MDNKKLWRIVQHIEDNPSRLYWDEWFTQIELAQYRYTELSNIIPKIGKLQFIEILCEINSTHLIKETPYKIHV